MITSVDVPRQRGPRAAGRRPDRLPPPRQLAPRIPIFLSQVTGYWPTLQSVVAQIVLSLDLRRRRGVRVRRQAAPARVRARIRRSHVAARRGLSSTSTMGVRVGVDVGGTFTKAVAVDSVTGELVARSVVPTTHTAAAGVAARRRRVRRRGRRRGRRRSASSSSPTRPRRPSTRCSRATSPASACSGSGADPTSPRSAAAPRWQASSCRPASGCPHRRCSSTSPTGSTTRRRPRASCKRVIGEGIGAVSVAEAFSPDDDRNEQTIVQIARDAGLPACASTELSGLYGLELRAVTAAVNASILPIAVRTAGFVEQGVRDADIAATVMVMRGDGGATDLAGFREAPVRTLYSGPGGIGRRCAAVRRDHRRRHRRGRRHVDQRRGGPRRPAADVVRDGGVACHGAARGRRARRRRRRRVDAAGAQAAVCTPSGRAARTSPGCRTPASSNRNGSSARPSRSSRHATATTPTTSCCELDRRDQRLRSPSRARPTRSASPVDGDHAWTPTSHEAGTAAFAIAGAHTADSTGRRSPSRC